jgi:hypothetical protein
MQLTHSERLGGDWSSDVCSSDLTVTLAGLAVSGCCISVRTAELACW